jgi:hypothetical protein
LHQLPRVRTEVGRVPHRFGRALVEVRGFPDAQRRGTWETQF